MDGVGRSASDLNWEERREHLQGMVGGGRGCPAAVRHSGAHRQASEVWNIQLEHMVQHSGKFKLCARDTQLKAGAGGYHTRHGSHGTMVPMRGFYF